MLYKEAARIIQLVENKQGSAKNLTLSSTYAVSVVYFLTTTTTTVTLSNILN